jgi:hypothetical protein
LNFADAFSDAQSAVTLTSGEQLFSYLAKEMRNFILKCQMTRKLF